MSIRIAQRRRRDARPHHAVVGTHVTLLDDEVLAVGDDAVEHRHVAVDVLGMRDVGDAQLAELVERAADEPAVRLVAENEAAVRVDLRDAEAGVADDRFEMLFAIAESELDLFAFGDVALHAPPAEHETVLDDPGEVVEEVLRVSVAIGLDRLGVGESISRLDECAEKRDVVRIIAQKHVAEPRADDVGRFLESVLLRHDVVAFGEISESVIAIDLFVGIECDRHRLVELETPDRLAAVRDERAMPFFALIASREIARDTEMQTRNEVRARAPFEIDDRAVDGAHRKLDGQRPFAFQFRERGERFVDSLRRNEIAEVAADELLARRAQEAAHAGVQLDGPTILRDDHDSVRSGIEERFVERPVMRVVHVERRHFKRASREARLSRATNRRSTLSNARAAEFPSASPRRRSRQAESRRDARG